MTIDDIQKRDFYPKLCFSNRREEGRMEKKYILKCKCILHITVFEKKKKYFKNLECRCERGSLCIEKGRMGGWGFFEYVWGHCLPWALIGLHSYVGHALCHLCFPSIVSCDQDSIPKANSLPKKKNKPTNVHCAAPDSLWSVCFSKWEIIYVDILLTFNLYFMIPANKRSTQDII